MSSSAANSDTRERLRACSAHRLIYQPCGRSIVFAALVRRNACVILLGRPPWHGSSKHWPSAFSVRLCAPASSARVGDGPGPDRHECFDAMQSKEVLTGCGCRCWRPRCRTRRRQTGGGLGFQIAALLRRVAEGICAVWASSSRLCRVRCATPAWRAVVRPQHTPDAADLGRPGVPRRMPARDGHRGAGSQERQGGGTGLPGPSAHRHLRQPGAAPHRHPAGTQP